MARRAIRGLRGILTGASSGIGRALAVELVREGARLIVVARRTERLEELTRELATAPGQIEILAGDVTSADVRAAAIERAKTAFGGLDLLINNAGIGAMGEFVEATPERLRQVMEVNFFAAAEMTRLAVPLLKTGQRPIVVNVSSVLGHRGVPGCAEYCASKFALQGWSESLRAELAADAIDVLVISPARTQTEFFERAIDYEVQPWPKLRGASSEKVARAIARTIRKGKHEIVISAGGKLLVWSSRLFPRVMDWVLARRG
ncbi:MAG: SDR family NAD(P)-dependent oxidoreductase [Pirellulales bacterium]